jgi:hypothetical protein
MRRDQLNLGLAEHGLISALRASALSAGFLGIQMWHGRVRSINVWQCLAGCAMVRQGLRKQHWGLRLPLLLSKRADLARTGRSGFNGAWHGVASLGKDCRRQYGGFALPTVLSGAGKVRLGMANYGQDGRVSVGFGDFGLG